MKRTPVQNGKPGGKGFEKPGSLTTENRQQGEEMEEKKRIKQIEETDQ